MAKNCKVLFQPDDVAIEVPVGTTILAAAIKAGVYVNSLCAGDGVCGRCRVIVREGTASGGTTEFFTREEIQKGYILACMGRINTDLVVEVPPESRLAGAPEHDESEVPILTDVSRLSARGLKLSPLVRKVALELPEPTLENNASDLQRLEYELGKTLGVTEFQMGLKVTRRLPRLLRDHGWNITAVTGYRGALTEIVDVEPDDTTNRNYCIATDIGTTTVVCNLVDLRDGQTLGRAAKYNSQAVYGADVIRRIIHASESPENESALRESVVGDLNELIGNLAARFRLGVKDITLISAAGNTAMIHLLLGLPAENIRKEPYIPPAQQLPPFRASEVGLQINPRGLLYCLPCVAGFVGADIVSGIFATELAQSAEVRMLIDIGTNGEIVIGSKDFLVCASASAGPAFEGSETRSGMRATSGAIDHIRLADPKHVLNYSTVGSKPPIGLCGTGYVDLIAEMLRVGLIDKTGRLRRTGVGNRVRVGKHDELEYVVIPAAWSDTHADICITQGDINNLLRAKGAIYAAASVLLNALGMTFDDIAEIMVAGAFGNFLNLANAVFIGLLPDVAQEKLRFVGNASLAGAKLAAISDKCYDEIFDIAAKTTYFELSTEPSFMDQFVSACFFPHTNVELFPSVMAQLSVRKER